MTTWQIHLDAWIIQDGNYADFCCGQIFECALGFYPDPITQPTPSVKRIESLGEAQYRVSGEVVYARRGIWILDFGVMAYNADERPENVERGSWVAGDILLGIDPYDYMELCANRKGIPPLIYTWRVERIQRQTAPFVEHRDEEGRTLLMRDRAQLGYADIPHTDAWRDDGGHAEYLLFCDLLSDPPKRERSET
jgi:hypothetical protein